MKERTCAGWKPAAFAATGVLALLAAGCGDGVGGRFGGGGAGDASSITVTSPNGGETWIVGNPATVSWSTTGTVGNVKIELSTNGGGSWTTLVSSTANDGSQSVTVPDSPSTQCRIRVSETDGSPSDTSNADFTISGLPVETYTISGIISGDVQGGVTLTLSGDATDSTVSAGDGTYSFSELPNGTYTITPGLAGYSFTPNSRTVTVSDANVVGLDFAATAVGPEPGWTHLYYDMAGTSYNPRPTDCLRQGGLLELWSDAAVNQYVVVLSGDVDGDGEKEVVCCQTRTVRIYSGSGSLENSFVLPGSVSHHVHLLADADSDGDLDIFLSSEDEGGTLTAYAYDALGAELQTYVRGGVGNDSSVNPAALLPDGKLLVYYHAGFPTQPRGWGCYDSASGSNTWHYELGNARYASVVNVPSVGWRLVQGWGTVHNGHSANGTTDGDLYTVVLDENGSAVFTQNYSSNGPTDGVVDCRILDLDGDGTYHVLATETHSSSSYPGMSQAHLLNIDTGAFEKTVDIVDNTGMGVTEAIADFDGDGRDEVAFAAGGGGASYVTRMLDDNIDLLSYTCDAERVWAANDIDGDGQIEVIASKGAQLRIYDGTLSTVESSFDAAASIEKAIVSDVNGDGVNEVVFWGGKVYCVQLGE